MFFESLILERNQRKKELELRARLQVLEGASLAELLETIRDDDFLVRRKHANIPVRMKAIQLLAERGDVEAVPQLLELLHDDAPAIQQEAIAALGRLGGSQAVGALIRIFHSPVSSSIHTIAKTALETLNVAPEHIASGKPPSFSHSSLPTNTSVQRLLMQLHHADWRIRRQAVEVLGTHNDPALLDHLLGCLTDTDWEVRLQAFHAVQTFQDDRVTEALILMMRDNVAEVSEAALQFTASQGKQAITPLTTLLGATDATVRENVVCLLRNINDMRVIEPLLRALCDSDAQVRQLATDALLARGEPVVEYLATRAQRPESKVRWKAVDAMSRLLDERMIPALSSALSDTEADIRELAAKTLRTLTWQPQTPDEHIAFAIAQSAWESLPPFGAQALAPLLKLADEKNVRVRRYLHEALAQACGQVKTMLFGEHFEEAPDWQTTVSNIDVSTLTYAVTKLQQVRISSDTYDFLLIERFLTYAVNALGEKFLKKNVTVHIIGDAGTLNPNLFNAFKNLCKSVDER